MPEAWRESWHANPFLVELEEGTRGGGERRGEVGLAQFSAGWYPACSLHGAMNRMGREQPAVWRCLAFGCNVGTRCVVGNVRRVA
jgi:hypothetical protein